MQIAKEELIVPTSTTGTLKKEIGSSLNKEDESPEWSYKSSLEAEATKDSPAKLTY
jgi:hypothetical protein